MEQQQKSDDAGTVESEKQETVMAKETSNNSGDWVADETKALGNIVETNKENVEKDIVNVQEEVKNEVENTEKETHQKVDEAKEKVNELKEGVQENANEMKENVENAKNWVEEEAKNTKKKICNDIENAKEDVKEKVDQAQQAVESKQDGITKGASTTCEGLSKSLNLAESLCGTSGSNAVPLIFVDDKELALYAHNYIRKQHGLVPYKWNDTLAASAKLWATKLAETNAGLQHSSMEEYGENIYMAKGTSSPMRTHQAVLHWYKTGTQFNYTEPNFSLTSGTFTQLVWNESAKVGVGVVYREDTKSTYIVAQYSPAGNFSDNDSFRKHVKPPLMGLPLKVPKLEDLTDKSQEISMGDNHQTGSNMKSLVDVLCHWCISTDEKPIESCSGAQQSRKEPKISGKKISSSTEETTADDKTTLIDEPTSNSTIEVTSDTVTDITKKT